MSNSKHILIRTGPGMYKWIIPDFLRLSRERNISLESPDFKLFGSTWSFEMGFSNNSRWINLNLIVYSCKCPQTYRCTLGLERADGSPETITTHIARIGLYHHKLLPCVFRKSATECHIEDLLFPDTLTITCHLKVEHDESQDRTYVSDNTWRTEMGSMTGKKRNAKHAVWTSSDLKGVSTLIKNFKDLLIKGNNSNYDVRIFVKNREFQAHSIILKARSPVFNMMLTHDTKEKNSGDIFIEDCDPDCFDEFLIFIYSGKTENLTPCKAPHLYYVADKYDLPELKEQCVYFMKKSLSVTSVYDVIMLAVKHEETELLEKATDFFVQNIKKILLTDEWQTFMSKHPIEANELYIETLEKLKKY